MLSNSGTAREIMWLCSPETDALHATFDDKLSGWGWTLRQRLLPETQEGLTFCACATCRWSHSSLYPVSAWSHEESTNRQQFHGHKQTE